MWIVEWLLALAFAQPAPPPPPPPPRMDMPPPPEIVAFVRAHAGDTEPWQVTLYEAPRGRKRVLSRAASVLVIANLLRENYSDGECGCWTNVTLGIRIARGGASLDLTYNAAHLMLTPAGHDGPFVIVADTTWIEEVRERAGL